MYLWPYVCVCVCVFVCTTRQSAHTHTPTHPPSPPILLSARWTKWTMTLHQQFKITRTVARTDGGMTKRERHATFEKYFFFISKHKHTNGFVCVDGSTFSLLVFWIRSNQLYGQSKHGIPIRPFINVARLIPSPHCHCYTSMNAKGFLPIRSRRQSSLSKYWCQIKYSFVRKASIAFMVIINQHRNHIQSKAREAKKKFERKGDR